MQARLIASEEAIRSLEARVGAIETNATTTTVAIAAPTTATTAGPLAISLDTIEKLTASPSSSGPKWEVRHYRTVDDWAAAVLQAEGSGETGVDIFRWGDQDWVSVDEFLPSSFDPVELEHDLVGRGVPRALVDWLIWGTLWPGEGVDEGL